MFDLNDPTNRDRLAMLRRRAAMIVHHPLLGVGPNMVGASTPRVSRTVSGRQPTPRTCTTCRCRSRPSAACRRSRSGSGSSQAAGRSGAASASAGRARYPGGRRAGSRRRRARRRDVRVQLRGFGVPAHAAPRADASVGRRPRVVRSGINSVAMSSTLDRLHRSMPQPMQEQRVFFSS